jgi:coenzyme F420-dependent glucose-6-phosphate dehydrogenase
VFEAAGHDHVYLHQVGPDQQGFLDFYASVILPEFE